MSPIVSRIAFNRGFGRKLGSNLISPTYSVSPSTSSVNEGSSVIFTVTTTNVANGTTLYWTTNTISGTVNTSDFSDAATTGSFTITDNSGSITRTLTSDSATEGTESFQLQIRTGSISGSVVATSTTVTINDTSVNYVPASDPLASSLKLAMPFANFNGANSYTQDYSATIRGSGSNRTISGGGTSFVTSPAPKFYTGSLQRYTSSGFIYASDAGNSDLHWYSNNNWTAEGWVYASAGSFSYNLISSSDDSSLYYWGFGVGTDNSIGAGGWTSGPSGVQSAANVVPRGSWYHWAFARSGSALAFWIDGTRVSYNASSSWNIVGNMGYVNLSSNPGSGNTVLQQDFRIYTTTKYSPSSSTITVPGAMYVPG